jgi:NADH-quinone oxidoreductase subunit N
MTFTSPVLSYTLLSPMLILLGGALIGVLVEAFVSKAKRPIVQLTLALGVLTLALFQVWSIRGEQSLTPAMGSIIIDGPAVLLQGSILIISIIAILLIADTEHFTALPAALPGSEEERRAIAMGTQVTEVYPLTLFAVSGMLMFPVAGDLITLFVALEMLSLPLYLMAGFFLICILFIRSCISIWVLGIPRFCWYPSLCSWWNWKRCSTSYRNSIFINWPTL